MTAQRCCFIQQFVAKCACKHIHSMAELLVVHVENMSGKLLKSMKDVAVATTGAQMKQLLRFQPDSMLSPKLLVFGGLMDDASSFSELGVESELTLTLIFSVEWGTCAKYKVIQELRSIGALAADSALAAASSEAMPMDAREWGLAHLRSLGAAGWRAGDSEQIRAVLAAVITDDPAHWLRCMAIEALYELGLAPSSLRVLADAASTDGNQGVRYLCMKAIGEVGQRALQTAPDVAGVLMTDSSRDVRIAAAQALASIGPAVLPQGAIALLEAAASDSELECRDESRIAFDKLMNCCASDSGAAAGLSDFSCMLEENAEALSTAAYGKETIGIARSALNRVSSKLHERR
eukprot:TRINITY_DN63903_c0_g1_i1.p1 TRINITY_DN63903_c0_g1~~TRINITY_DN63903_c0_g1_i1.p1  ORF type:complete len:349 (-),score=72.82 TRINITY_DN63903_c0_g1_i1:253-1299(-)